MLPGSDNASSLPAIAHAWRGVTFAIDLFCQGTGPAAVDGAALITNLQCLAQHHLGDTASAWCLRRLKDSFKSGVVPRFWDHFTACARAPLRPDGGVPDRLTRRRCFVAFGSAVRTLYEAFVAHLEVLAAVEAAAGQAGLRAAFQMDLRAYVHYSQQPVFADVARLFFKHTFLSFASMHSSDAEDAPEAEVDKTPEVEAPEAVAQAFAAVCAALHRLELVDRCAPVCINMLYERVATRIDRLCEDNYSVPLLSEVLQWVEEVAVPWLAVFASSPHPAAEDHPLFQQWRTRLEYFVYHTYGNHRLAHLFDIVVDFPDSEPAVLDLQTCLAMTGQHPQLIHEAKRQIRQRLLHAGAKTTDILRFLINLIKAVNVLYGHGGMLERLSEDIKAYVRQRKDTVRSIVLGMIDDRTSSDLADLLHQELKSSNEDNTLTVYYSSDEEEAVVQPSQGKPVPLRSTVESKAVDIAKVLGLSQKTDITKTLVSIFGTKDVFVEEYRTILAGKLLACENYDTTREVVALELLKIRFGEAALQGCEVMVRDVAESKRIHSNAIHVQQRDASVSDVQLDCTIVSKLFWPECAGDEFTPHPRLAALQEQYCAHYRRLKAPRTLQYQPWLGTVSMELQYPTGSVQVTANPLHASILLHFEDRPRWSEEELAETLGMEVSALQRHLRFWTSKGVVEEEMGAGQYVLVEDAGAVAVDDASYQEEEEDGQLVQSPPKEADWKSIEPFIINTLTNLQSLDLSGIYNYLRWLATDPPFRHTEVALREHLQSMIHDDLLVLENGKYRLKSRRR